MDNIASYQLTVDGIALPTPRRSGVTVTDEPVWSANTGRTASGRMVGSIVTIKTTVLLEWGDLTPAQAELLRGVLSDRSRPFRSLTLTDIDGKARTLEVYFGTPQYVIKTVTGGGRITGATVSAIER